MSAWVREGGGGGGGGAGGAGGGVCAGGVVGGWAAVVALVVEAGVRVCLFWAAAASFLIGHSNATAGWSVTPQLKHL